MNETIKVIQNHRSIRSFIDKDIDNQIIDEILKASQSMPSSINGQQTSAIVIRDKETKAKIAHFAGDQKWIDDAPVFVIFIMDFYKTKIAAEINGLEQVINESIEGTIVGTFDSGLAMGAAIIAAESLGLGIVPIGGVRKNPKEIIEILELPSNTYPIAGLAIGYPKDNSKKKPRLPFNTFRHDEKYNKDIIEDNIKKYDETMETYLRDIGREQEGNWSKLTSGLYKYVYYPEVYPTIKKQGFDNNK
ncbi:FMN reductase [NAD(P)H] [Clostridium saccharoperbutylacetonicum]|uniref:FMN reductase n=1 Tax=Clostridium saccharoperbutylacetonicum N1-4(HMT) TaxID=931276 RepID=M1MXR3_9CLOT|nr:NADPH-dependent oxidoreductase [Clostridium saccharoperbutylacetonicum]AGF56212.1 FMN reductase [Clostridium saccharoperbutylacetonicum N1-4(HMT)]NRT63046.1 FMN reductase [NAD(P)H] [Clostridium saccharoperbutylacetonicum]NSB26403.1 FMN reductase [NAD(P)H] [Clostridium saccharoperbutylacetonicum]NSB45756.1 FMN reductase [NAD(P)H] [Clostridium saccharoperbutylacetonicum]